MTVTTASSIIPTTVLHSPINEQVMFKAKTRLSRTRESAWEKEQAKALRDIRKERKMAETETDRKIICANRQTD